MASAGEFLSQSSFFFCSSGCFPRVAEMTLNLSQTNLSEVRACFSPERWENVGCGGGGNSNAVQQSCFPEWSLTASAFFLWVKEIHGTLIQVP